MKPWQRVSNASRLLWTAWWQRRRVHRGEPLPESFWARFENAYYRSGGGTSRLLERMTPLIRSGWGFRGRSGVLGSLSPTAHARALTDLKKKGYHVFETRLPEDLCAALGTRALSALPDPLYRVACPRFTFDAQYTIEQPEIESFITDPAILSVAEAFVGSRPVCDLVALRWNALHLPVADGPHFRADEMFYYRPHFHVQGLRTLVLFVYLNDIDSTNSPHSYILGSHREKAGALQKQELPDETLLRTYYPEGRWKELTGPRGTVIAIDAEGFHYGKPVERGGRLLLTVAYTHALTERYATSVEVNARCSPSFRTFVRDHPRIFPRHRFRRGLHSDKGGPPRDP